MNPLWLCGPGPNCVAIYFQACFSPWTICSKVRATLPSSLPFLSTLTNLNPCNVRESLQMLWFPEASNLRCIQLNTVCWSPLCALNRQVNEPMAHQCAPNSVHIFKSIFVLFVEFYLKKQMLVSFHVVDSFMELYFLFLFSDCLNLFFKTWCDKQCVI